MEKEVKGAILDMDDTLYDYKHSNEKGTEAVLEYAEKKLNEESEKQREKNKEALDKEKIDDKRANTEKIENFMGKLNNFNEPEESVSQKRVFTRDEIKTAIGAGRKETNEAMPTQGASHSRLLYFQKAIETLTGKTNFELTLEMEKVFRDSFIEHMQIYDGALEFLKKLKQTNRKVTILTDLTAQVQHKKIIKLLGGNQHYVDYLVSSEEVGEEKPGSKGFDLSMRKMGISEKDEVCMIGDNYKKDIIGAKNFGITKLYHKVNDEGKQEGEEGDGVTHFKFFSEIQGDF